MRLHPAVHDIKSRNQKYQSENLLHFGIRGLKSQEKLQAKPDQRCQSVNNAVFKGNFSHNCRECSIFNQKIGMNVTNEKNWLAKNHQMISEITGLFGLLE